jgi:hypothetical protein
MVDSVTSMDQALQQHILNRFWIDDEGYIRRRNASSRKPAGTMVAASTQKNSQHLILVFSYNQKQKGLSYGRVAWLLHYGEVPGLGLEIDHVDRDPRNNRKSNLRLATRTEQVWNTRGHRNGPKNVYYDKVAKTWNVQLQVKGKVHGRYQIATEQEAAVIAAEMRAQLHGQFAFDTSLSTSTSLVSSEVN